MVDGKQQNQNARPLQWSQALHTMTWPKGKDWKEISTCLQPSPAHHPPAQSPQTQTAFNPYNQHVGIPLVPTTRDWIPFQKHREHGVNLSFTRESSWWLDSTCHSSKCQKMARDKHKGHFTWSQFYSHIGLWCWEIVHSDQITSTSFSKLRFNVVPQLLNKIERRNCPIYLP